MTKKAALKLKVGNKVFVQAPHYTGKMRLTEPPESSRAGSVRLLGIGAGGLLLGCAHGYASRV